jgi:Tat protein secretion system quality control protein TatD with DNase activity
MRIFDTHAHYNDSRFNDYEGGMDKAIKDSYEAGVCGFINCGTCPESSRRSIEIARQYENAYAAVGIHPESAEELRDNLPRAYDEIISLLSDEKVVAIGEIGLAGECRGISSIEQRVKEAARLGFTTALIPASNASSCPKIEGIKIYAVKTIYDVLKFLKSENK